MALLSRHCYQDLRHCHSGFCRRGILFKGFVAIFCLFFAWGKAAEAQSPSLPKDDYYRGLAFYYQGRFKLAENSFKRASSGYITGTGDGRLLWVDAVCAYTMIAECYYKAGDLTTAMAQYRNALDVYFQNRGWLSRVTFPATFQASESAILKANINWGKTTRQGAVGRVPKMQVLFGDRNLQNNLQNGGVVREPEHRIVDVDEIMRCTALAMMRRREILGKLGPRVPYSRYLAAETQSPAIPNHPYAVSWTSLINGIALASNNEMEKALIKIRAGAQAKGYDHPLTAIALMEMANIHFQLAKFKEASLLYQEASFSAAIYQQWDLLGESFEKGFKSHLLSGAKSEFLPVNAILSGDLLRKISDSAKCNLLLTAAESKIEFGSAADAATILQGTNRYISKELSRSQFAARYYFLTAQINALNADVPSAMRNARLAFQTFAGSAKRIFQISAAFGLDMNGAITPRLAELIYSELLNEPTNADWLNSPLEAMTFLLSPLQDARNRWFQIAMMRNEHEKAIEIADNIRRFQFYNSMPMGGRLLAFRWMLEAPDTMVSPDVIEQRKLFELAYPEYAGLSRTGKEIENNLRKIKGLPEKGTDEEKQHTALVNELTRNALTRELMLVNASLRRNAAPMSFPPRLNFGELQKKLTAKQAAWIFFVQGNQAFSFFLTKDAYRLDKSFNATHLQRFLPQILKKMGNVGVRTAPVTQKVLEENGWKKPATDLMKALQPKNVDWESYDELVIVPDGPLWYLPFEVLQVEKDGKTEFLGNLVAIRYAPTVSTVVPDKRKISRNPNTLVVAGRMTKAQDKERTETEIQKLLEKDPNITVLNRRIPFDSASYSSQIDSLLVWDEIENAEKLGGFEWSPLQVDKSQPRSQISAWMGLPFKGPERYIIPGFHTLAGSGRVRGNGEEIFLTVCGMMASGARTILLSRWAVGGENDYNLTRNFLTEVKNQSAAKAWRRARALTSLNDINPDLEPRIRSLKGDNPLKTDHPFFWSGYLLIDTGVQPVQDQPLPAKDQ